MKKIDQTGWIVIGVFLFILTIGLGMMFSGEKEDIRIIEVPTTDTVFNLDKVLSDTTFTPTKFVVDTINKK